MSQRKIRRMLFFGAAVITLAVLAFIYVLNSGQTEQLRRTFLGYIALLGLFSVAAFAVFFFAGPVFRADGGTDNGRVISIMLIILFIVQIAFAFASYAYRQARFCFGAYDNARAIFADVDWTMPASMLDARLAELPPEIDFVYILDSGGNPVYITPGFTRSDIPASDAAPERYLFPRDGHMVGMRISKAYNASVTRSILLELSTVLLVSEFFTYELVLLALTYIGRRERGRPDAEGKLPVSAFAYIRQLAFLFFFSSRMGMSFLPVMASGFATATGSAGRIAAGVPQSAETLLTCAAIMLTSELIIRRGWKPPFIFGLILAAAGTFLSALAGSMAVFLISRAIVGLGYGFCWMTLRNLSLLAPSGAERAHGFALLSAGIYAGINCGSVMGSILAGTIGYVPVLIISAIFTALCVPAVMLLQNAAVRRQIPAPDSVSDVAATRGSGPRGYLQAVSFVLLMIMPASIIASFSSYYIPMFFTETGRSLADVGRVQMIYGLIIIYIGPWVSKRAGGSFRTNLLYVLLLAGSLICFGLTGSFVVTVLTVSLIAFADGFGSGAQNEYFLRLPLVNRLPQSRSLSLLSLFKKFAEMLGPLAFAVAMGFTGVSGVLGMGLIFLLAALVASVGKWEKRKKLNDL